MCLFFFLCRRLQISSTPLPLTCLFVVYFAIGVVAGMEEDRKIDLNHEGLVGMQRDRRCTHAHAHIYVGPFFLLH